MRVVSGSGTARMARPWPGVLRVHVCRGEDLFQKIRVRRPVGKSGSVGTPLWEEGESSRAPAKTPVVPFRLSPRRPRRGDKWDERLRKVREIEAHVGGISPLPHRGVFRPEVHSDRNPMRGLLPLDPRVVDSSDRDNGGGRGPPSEGPLFPR
jgi:hypothetical protein